VIRGDDHVNNTPRQINIYKALGATVPDFAHMPMILDPEGAKLSKRHGAADVMQYQRDGYLPHALVNYLARLGWSHGDDEIFSKEQLVQWFDLEHVSRSPAQFNPEKLAWINQQYLKAAPAERLSALTGIDARVVDLLKERANTLTQLKDEAKMFSSYPAQAPAVEFDRGAFQMLKSKLAEGAWERGAIGAAIKDVAKASGLKMPAIAMPLRLMTTGRAQTPSIDAVLELLGRETVLARMAQGLGADG
jgi:glutamyl-tRNA synthetase